MDTITAADVADFIARLAEVMPTHEQTLRDLDAQIGDGDLGVTVSLGTRAMADGLADLSGEDPGTVLAKSGMAFNRAAASTFGVIFATVLMSMGKVARGKDVLTVADLPDMFEAAVEGVKSRGGAELGEKTVLDVLAPMAATLREVADAGASIPEAIAAATASCYEALEATKQMQGKHGRAGWFKERTVGVPDPGCTAICLMMDVLRYMLSP
jgi:dihydroxyacetone kinase-like protein